MPICEGLECLIFITWVNSFSSIILDLTSVFPLSQEQVESTFASSLHTRVPVQPFCHDVPSTHTKPKNYTISIIYLMVKCHAYFYFYFISLFFSLSLTIGGNYSEHPDGITTELKRKTHPSAILDLELDVVT